VETDLLARIHAELEQRMVELRPLLGEYERLLEAANTLAAIEAAPADGLSTSTPAPQPTAPRRRARDRSEIDQRGSAAAAIKLAASAPELPAPVPEPPPALPAPRRPRLLPATPTLRTQPMLSAMPALPTKRVLAAVVQAPPAVVEPVVEEFEPEPEPERKPAMPSDVRQAILAALEHGSHTIGELVMVTAMSTPEIRTNLSQLARQRKVTRVKREGDGKSAFALPASSART
jgi:hypothetical protein